MSPELEAILALGELDRELIRVRKRLERAPQLAAPQRERVRVAKAELDRLADEGKRGKLEVGRLEGEAKAKQQEIEKAQLALNQAKSNEEYQAHLKTIAARKDELSDIETRILLGYEAQEQREARTAGGKARLQEQERELKEAEQRVAEEEARVREEIAALEAKRTEARGRVDSAQLALYDRILERMGDSAIAELVDEHCQGCFIKARPDQISKVRGGNELVPCTSCDRFLYMRR